MGLHGRLGRDDREHHHQPVVRETVARLDAPDLRREHQGLLLHSVYHRPNGWDAIPAGAKVPAGESSMWGDYHAREVALYVMRVAEGGEYLKFWS